MSSEESIPPGLDPGEFDVHITNYPAGKAGEIREVILGTEDVGPTVLVLEIDWMKDPFEVSISVGNGPPNNELAVALPEMLHWVSDVVLEASETDEFRNAMTP